MTVLGELGNHTQMPAAILVPSTMDLGDVYLLHYSRVGMGRMHFLLKLVVIVAGMLEMSSWGMAVRAGRRSSLPAGLFPSCRQMEVRPGPRKYHCF